MQVLDFGRSSVTFGIDLDRMAPRTLSHKHHIPPHGVTHIRRVRLPVAEGGQVA